MMVDNATALRASVRTLFEYIGEDPARQGLSNTPDRWMKAWRDTWASGYGVNPLDVLTVFDAEGTDEMVVIRDIPVWSHCEHHLAPFFGVAHVGYIPDKHIAGLSKFKRLVDVYARRLQNQERLTCQVADCILEVLEPIGVGVVMECRHTCMESRGVQTQGSATVTTKLHGAMKEQATTRAEFLAMVNARLGGTL